MERQTISGILENYRSGKTDVRSHVQFLLDQIEQDSDKDAVFIHLLSLDELECILNRLDRKESISLPLYGVPFVIKDNIDLAVVPTTAGCESYKYMPEQSAFVVEQLIQAGAIPLGKVNLDQFATGLVGVRTPYGIPVNPVNPEYIPGGSSCGSAVAVAKGYAAFSLGTDTAGSGRVPAVFNELIGLKPTRGVFSNRGLVPACKSLDCISVFANEIEDAKTVFEIANKYDEQDDFSCPYLGDHRQVPDRVKIGIPQQDQLCFFGNCEYEVLFSEYVDQLRKLSFVDLQIIDFDVFLKTAELLYEGPWIAERYAAVGSFIEDNPGAAHPVTEAIIGKAKGFDATSVFESLYQLQHFKKKADAVLDELDAILTPTTGTHYKVSEVLENPVQTNSNLGYYTNFMNLLDLSAIAIPAGRTKEKNLPFGVTYFAPAQEDHFLMNLASVIKSGKNDLSDHQSEDTMEIAVCGAHMKGLALNQQLIGLGGTFVRETKTSNHYRFFCLHHKNPIRPGLIRDENHIDACSIDLEIWRLPKHNIGVFLSMIQEPLGLGSVETITGEHVYGFMCEGWVKHHKDCEEITSFGSWRTFLENP